ncbi:MAG: ankyrin repeat domain-containing protein [Gemmatimonadota bacterium]|nr:ankyrin repeat domain-containing protein [Gemmatimonadota bacterium]
MPSAVRGRGKTVAAALTAVVLLSAAAPGRVAYSANASVAATTESPVADAAMRGDSAKVRTLLRQGIDANAAQADGMTALHWASARGDAGQVHVLVVAGARLEATTRNGNYTPLHLAAQAGRGATVRALLEAGANANAVTTSGGATALHMAAAQGNIEAVTALLEYKATVDARESDWSQTPLMWAATYDRVPAIEALLQHGANIEAVSKVENMADREKADRASNALRTRKVLAIKGAETAPALPEAGTPRAVGTATASGSTATSTAAPAGRGVPTPPAGAGAGVVPPSTTGPVSVLSAETAAAGIPPGNDAAKLAAAGNAADKKSDRNDNKKAKNRDDAKRVSVAVVAPGTAHDSALAATAPKPLNGAPKVEKPQGQTGPVIGGSTQQVAAPGQSYGDLVGNKGGLTPLLFAARQGNTASIKALIKGGAKVNHVSDGDHTSPLLMATINGQFDVAKMLLLEDKADPKLASDANATPLYAVINVQWAAKSLYPQPTAQYQQQTTYLELMEDLLKAGADVNARLSKHLWYMSFNFDLLGVNTTGATPFWRAAYGTDVDAMKLLVKYGADPKIPTTKPAGPQRDQDGAIVEEGAPGTTDPSGLAPVPAGGPGVYPIHAASGVGYGEGFAANAHRHAPDGWLPSVKYLIEDLKLDVNARDFNGYNALHDAAARGDTTLAAYLVSKGGDIHAISRKGQTVTDMANGPVQRVPPFSEAVVFLEKLGSKNSNKCKSC